MAKPAKRVEGVYEKNPGSGVWYARFRVNGKLVRKAVGTRQQAISYVEKARTIRRTGSGLLPTTAKRAARTFAELAVLGDGTTVGELCDRYLQYILLPSNPEELTDLINPRHRVAAVKQAFGGRPAATLRPHEIKDWLLSLGIASATRNRYKSTLSAIFRYGKEHDLVSENPCRDVPHFRVELPNPRYMADAEEQRLRGVIQKWIEETPVHHKITRLYLQEHQNEITVAAGTGMRKGNQYALTFNMLDFERRLIILPRTKNGKPHTIHMIDDVYDALLDQQRIQKEISDQESRGEGSPRHSVHGRVFSIRENREWFSKARKESGLKDLRWHDLSRHTAGSRLAQAGANLKIIQEVLGHRTLAMAARYSHLDKSHLAESMKALNRKTA